MKTINDFTRKAAMLLSAFAVLLVSCNDEDKLKGDGDKNPVVIADSLANAFAEQIAAVRTLSADTETGMSYAVLRESGEALIALTDETSFVSYPDEVEYYPLLACHLENGASYWAVLDKEGNAEPLKDASDALIPLTEDVTLKLAGNGYALVAAGKEFDTAFTTQDNIQAFACDFHMDAESKIYAATFEFAKDLSKTYLSLNYNRVGFLLPYDLEGENVSEFFVSYSSTSSIVLEIPEGVAYSLDVTDGCTAVSRKLDALTYVDITAPAKSDDQPQYVLKVVSQECGIVLAELSIVNNPFHSLFTSTSDAFVEPTVGLRKFVYGLSKFDEYSEENAMSVAQGLVAGTIEPAVGYGLAEESVKVALAELLGSELDSESRYVLWAVPALYREGGNAGYYVEEGSVYSYEFGAMALDLELVEAGILDAQISVSANGVEGVYGGVVEYSEDAMELVASKLRNAYYTPIAAVDGEFSFTGLMSDYPAADAEKNEILPATKYLVWIAPAFSGEYPYEVEDLTCMEVTTGDVVAGGSVEPAFGDVVMDRDSFTVPVNAPGASMIYYAVVEHSAARPYTADSVPDAQKLHLIKSNSPILAKGESVTVVADKLKPSNQYWIFAAAVDAEGKYGPVKCITGTTNKMTYDTGITLSIAVGTITSSKIEYNVKSNGGDLSDYIYWFGTSQDPFWANSNYCAKDYRTGQEYMALNPDDEHIRKAMNKYGELSADGKIVMDGLIMDTEYVFIILEKGETDYSKCARSVLKTLAANLGTVVKEGTDLWNQTKASVTLDWIEGAFAAAENSAMMASYAFNFSCPKNLTAFVMCGSDTYFSEAGITKMEHIMIEIENYASRRYANSKTPYINETHATEPDYVKNGEKKGGQLMNVYEFNVHGVPDLGFVTYFAEGSHGEGNCIYWENGVCAQYEADAKSIAEYNTLAPWERKAEMFGLKGDEAATWAQALLEAYSVYYKDAKPIIYENTGEPIRIMTPYATGVNEDGVIPDRVIVMFKDLEGNYYEPMFFEVPNLFK